MYDGEIDSDTLPNETQSATCMTKLTMENIYVSATQTYINFKKYLTMKYPDVTDMTYSIFVRLFVDVDVKYNMKTGLGLQMNQIGPQLKSSKIGYNEYLEHIILVLDNNGYKLKEFSMGSSREGSEVNELVQSSQAQYIQSLSLRNILADNFIGYLWALKPLTELSLDCISLAVQQGRVAINIKKILESVGNTLVTLQISRAETMFSSLVVREYPSLRYLTLHKSIASRRTDHFISQSFPSLHTLIFDDIAWEESTLYLGNLSRNKGRYSFYQPVRTTSNNFK